LKRQRKNKPADSSTSIGEAEKKRVQAIFDSVNKLVSDPRFFVGREHSALVKAKEEQESWERYDRDEERKERLREAAQINAEAQAKVVASQKRLEAENRLRAAPPKPSAYERKLFSVIGPTSKGPSAASELNARKIPLPKHWALEEKNWVDGYKVHKQKFWKYWSNVRSKVRSYDAWKREITP
jgi:hypothetical protein